MASMGNLSGSIHVFHRRHFHSRDAGSIAGEPHLILGLIYSVDGERVEVLAESRHRFAECSPSSLRAFIREREPPLLETLMDPRDAEITRGTISNMVDALVRDCTGIEGLNNLHVNVIFEICQELGESLAEMELDDVKFRRRQRRMSLLQKGVYMGAAMAENEKEVCAICLDELRVGEEVACTPCIHLFHDACIGRWFESNGLCPLCRFKIEPF